MVGQQIDFKVTFSQHFLEFLSLLMVYGECGFVVDPYLICKEATIPLLVVVRVQSSVFHKVDRSFFDLDG